MISVVIPAHNEESVIGRCLAALLDRTSPGEVEVIVVCNGCEDRTAAVARGFGSCVRVIETEVASKSEALNLGDQQARSFPRFYVDADVVLRWPAVRAVADVLERGDALVAAPRLAVAVDGRPWAVRAYYEIWTRLPYHAEGTIGSGVYALSALGRSRFERFPTIVSDDGYIRLLFPPEKRITVQSHTFEITPPRSLRALIDIKTRSQKGLLELYDRFPELRPHERRNYRGALREIFSQPRLWPMFFLYVALLVVTRLRARRRYRGGRQNVWERDEGSRSAFAGRSVR
jgi:glycosyltransferase involved in cell wall biosynthesis